MPRSPAATACRLLHWPSKKASAHPISRGLSASAISPRTSRELFSTGASRAGWPQTSCWYSRVCRWLGTISGPCSALLEPIPALSFIDIAGSRAAQPRWRRRPHRREPHRRHCGTEISPDRDTTGSSARCCWTCASLPTAPSGILPTLAENPGFSRNQGEIRKETDSLLEGDGFELPVPREKGWSFDGSLSSAPFKSLGVSTKTTRFLHEGPMVRIRLPPAVSLRTIGSAAKPREQVVLTSRRYIA